MGKGRFARQKTNGYASYYIVNILTIRQNKAIVYLLIRDMPPESPEIH